MASVIWKQPVDFGEREYAFPGGAEIVHFGIQQNRLMVWFLCDPTQTERWSRKLTTVGTGHEIPYRARRLAHHGTVQDPQGFVWHLLEVLP